MSAIWRLNLLGGLSLIGVGETNADSPVRLPATRTGTLLARLALPAAGRSYSREALAELLWPDKSVSVGRHRLRQTLVDLRSLLGSEGALITERASIGLQPGILQTDVADFQGAIQAAENAARAGDSVARLDCLTRAADFYVGELLPTFDAQWISDERYRLRILYLDCLKALALCAEAQQDMLRAISAARRLAAEEPHEEESSLLLLRLLTASGQTEAARREYGRFRKVAQRADVKLSAAFRRQVRELSGKAAILPSLGFAPKQSGSSVTDATTIPAFMTRFFGREDEIGRLACLLSDPSVRLVTLVGPGGFGKTRLAVEAVTQLPRAVCFVGLAEIPASAGVPGIAAQIMAALGLPPAAQSDDGTKALNVAADVLRSRVPLLLLLDNLEHLLTDGAARTAIPTLLARVPGLTILATSRLPIAIAGETTFPVSPLPVNAEDRADEPMPNAIPLSGISLFVDRVRALRPDFALTEETTAAVTTLCQRLDGLPLALEIAAGWARTLTVEEMLKRLDQRFAFLVRRGAEETDRHRSLEAAIDWSYSLLPPETARFYRRLSVFRAGFTGEAATAVADSNDGNPTDHLEILCEHNLLVATASARLPEMRFTMLETLREFAAERMPSDEQVEAEWRHVAFFNELAWAGDAGLKGPEQGLWWERLAIEKPNLRAALSQTDRGIEDGILRARLAAGLITFGYLEDVWESSRWQEAALTIPALPANLRGRLLAASGRMSSAFGDKAQGQAKIAEAVRLLRETDDEEGLADTLAQWADSPNALADAVELCSRTGRKRLLGAALNFQATQVAYSHNREEALQKFQMARRHFNECQAWTSVQGSLMEEAHHRSHWGEIAVAAEMLEDFFRLAQVHRLRDSSSFTSLHRLARLRQLQGDWKQARELLARAERQVRHQGMPFFMAEVFLQCARLHTDIYEMAQAYFYLEEYEKIQAGSERQLGLVGWSAIIRTQLALLEGDNRQAARQADIALSAYSRASDPASLATAKMRRSQAARQAGETALAVHWSHAAVKEALAFGSRWGGAAAIEDWGQAAASDGRFSEAAFALGFAAAEREAMGIVLTPVEQLNHEAAVSSVRSILPSPLFTSLWTQGSRSKATDALRHIESKPPQESARRPIPSPIAR